MKKEYLVQWGIDQEAESMEEAGRLVYEEFFKGKGFGTALYLQVTDPDTEDTLGFDYAEDW
jgi:hypothetical protein